MSKFCSKDLQNHQKIALNICFLYFFTKTFDIIYIDVYNIHKLWLGLKKFYI